MIPIIKKLQKRFEFPKPIVVADAGLLSKENIRDLEKDGYEYILGARIRSQSEQFKDKVASLGLSNGQSSSIPLTASRRMVVTMSDSRAKKNAADRERGLKRIEKRFKTDKLTKDKLNNRGYNRFLAMEGDAFIKIDYAKVEKDARLDGLKGYTTNSTLSDARVIEEYGYLFMIERTFRFCKTDLDIRPMYHRLFNRIEATRLYLLRCLHDHARVGTYPEGRRIIHHTGPGTLPRGENLPDRLRKSVQQQADVSVASYQRGTRGH